MLCCANFRWATHLTAAAVVTLLVPVAAAAPASAHERWFVDNTAGGDWGFFLSPLPLALTAAVVLVTVVWRLAAHWLPSPELRPLRPLGRFTAYLPRLLAVYLGVSLLALAIAGDFLAHSLQLRDVPGGSIAGLVEGILGVWFITGIRLRTATFAFATLSPLALLAAGPVALFESAVLFGIAAFLWILPPSDRTFGSVKPDQAVLRAALLALRVGVATSLVTLAFSEKFANPELASHTLAKYPLLNVPSLIGIQVPHDTFTAVAGSVELFFGLLLLSGALPQVAVLVAAVPFNATLLLFGQTELIGHLPVYGVFIVLLVYGSSPATAPAVSWLPRLGSAPAEAAAPQVRRVVTRGVNWPVVVGRWAADGDEKADQATGTPLITQELSGDPSPEWSPPTCHSLFLAEGSFGGVFPSASSRASATRTCTAPRAEPRCGTCRFRVVR